MPWTHLRQTRLMVLFGIFLGFILLELLVRIIQPRALGTYAAFQSDSVLHHKLPPNVRGKLIKSDFETDFHTNSLSLRDREYSLVKPAKTYRILMLGDSYTEGQGVDIEQTSAWRSFVRATASMS